ncbi:hypothetical protein P7K49_009292 [Saguinus oedipus]|uniref:Uncharacterized protein n=1 Tax=Saguinus oedipus TaxID=9490 RepID=A0ABQ9VJK2_SAGOE|nr:hypothetical protein P7K49_009292 [Saguinus oedipus]
MSSRMRKGQTPTSQVSAQGPGLGAGLPGGHAGVFQAGEGAQRGTGMPGTLGVPFPLVGASNCPAAGPLPAARAEVAQERERKLAGLGRDQTRLPRPERKLGARGPPPPVAAQFLVGAGAGTGKRPRAPQASSRGRSGAYSPTPATLPTWRGAQVLGGAAAAPPAGQTAAGLRADAECVCRGAAPPSTEGLGSLLHDPPEDCRSDGGSSSGSGSSSAGEPGGAESSSSPHVPERETPEPGDADGPEGHLAAKQRPVARSKIKVLCRLCPRRHKHHALASGSRGPRPSL